MRHQPRKLRVSIHELTEHTGLSGDEIRKHMDRGELRTYTVGYEHKIRLILRSAANEFLAARGFDPIPAEGPNS
jgi:hypothetical protein